MLWLFYEFAKLTLSFWSVEDSIIFLQPIMELDQNYFKKYGKLVG